MSRSYNLGFCTGKINTETVSRLLLLLPVPCEPYMIRNVEEESIHMMDTLFLANPVFDNNQQKAFVEYVENGGTALFMLALEDTAYKQSEALLSTFGVKIDTTTKAKRIPIDYLENYPKAHKRGENSFILANTPTIFPLFAFKNKADTKHNFPLIAVRTFLIDSLFAVKVVYGRGAVIFMCSSCLSEDRAELLEHLLTLGGSTKSIYRSFGIIPNLRGRQANRIAPALIRARLFELIQKAVG